MNYAQSLDAKQRRRRNLAWALIVCAFTISFFQRFAPAGIAPDLALAFDTTASSLGVLAATYFYVYTVMQIPTGIFVDTLGPRRILLIGGVVSSLGSLLFGLATSLDMALLGRTLIGLGVSVVFISMLKFIAVWFDEKRFASMVGVSLLLANFGSVLAGSPLSGLAQSVGWRQVFVGIAVLSLLLAVLCWLLVRDQAEQEAEKPIHKSRFDRTVILSGLLVVLKNPASWPATWINLSVSGTFFTFGGLWAAPYLMSMHSMSRAVAANHISLYFATFALGCVCIGTLSDRLGKRKPVLIVGTHLYLVGWLILLSGMSLSLFASYSLFAILGVLTSSFSLSWACAKEVNPPLLSGMSTSITNMGGFLAAALLQPLFGKLMDWHWNGDLTATGVRLYSAADYQAGIFLLTLIAAVGAVAAWRLRETNCRNIWIPPTPHQNN